MSKRSRLSTRDRIARLNQLRRRDSSRPETRPISSNENKNELKNLLPRRKKSRFARLITPLVIVVLLVLAGVFYVRQSVDVERIVRNQVIPQLEKQLNARVEIGSIDSDYLSRVTLHKVVIGRDAKQPLGALAQIETVTISLDLPSLVLHRADALSAVSAVDLQSPRVVLRRDAQGVFNWSKLWKSSPTTSSARWSGLVTARDGRVWYQDATIKTRRGVALVVDAQGISARVEANGAAPATFLFNVPRAFVGHKPQQTALHNLAFQGSADSAGKWVSIDLRGAQIPVALPIEYSNLKFPLRAQGEIGGALQISYDTTRPVARRLLLAGNLTAREVGISLPNTAEILPVGWRKRLQRGGETPTILHWNGPLRFDNRAFSTTGMTLQTLGTNWKIGGNFTLPDANSANQNAVFDVTANARNLDATRLSRLIPFEQTALGATTISGARENASVRGSANLHLSGDAQRAKIGGDIVLPNARIRSVQWGELASQEIRVAFGGDSAGRAADARFSLREVAARDRNGVSMQSRVLDGAASWRQRNANVNASAAQIGLKLNSPEIALQKTQSGSAQSGALNAQVALQLQKNGGVWTARGKADLRAQTLAARVISARAVNDFRSANVVAVLDFSGNLLRHNAMLRFDARDFSARGTDGDARTSTARGSVSWQRRGAQVGGEKSLPLSTDFVLTGLQARPNAEFQRRISPQNRALFASEIRVTTLRVLASTPNALSNQNSAQWNGATQFAGFDASQIRLAALAPDVARRVRNLGVVNGRAQFAFDAKTPRNSVLNGQFSLSRAQIDDVKLRAISTGVALKNGVVRLFDARAQSDEGSLRLDAVYDLARAQGNLGLSAPLVTLSAARINPFLRASGVRFQGMARGSLRLATAFSRGVLAPVQTSFDLQIPRARLISLATNRVLDNQNATQIEGAQIEATNGRLRGRGAWRGIKANWNFIGRTEISLQNAQISGENSRSPLQVAALKNATPRALKLGVFALPKWTNGAQFSALNLVAQGQISQTSATGKSVFSPQISGDFGAARAQFRLPSPRSNATRSLSAPTFVAQKIRATFTANSATSNLALNSSAQPNSLRLQIARWQAEIPQLQTPRLASQPQIEYSKGARAQPISMPMLSGYLNLADGNFAGQVLARDLDVSRAQRLADLFLPDNLRSSQPALRGVLFARADLAGTLQNPRAIVQARLYRGAIAANGKIIPLDVARATLALAPATSQFGVREIVLWSHGGRLAVAGNVAPLTPLFAAKSASNSGALALDLTLQLNNWRVRDLVQMLPRDAIANTATNAKWSQIDGALSGDLKLSGTTTAPRVGGRATLRLANLAGVDVPELSTQVAAENTDSNAVGTGARGWRFAFTDIRGRAEDANLAGEARLDLARKSWSARLVATDAPVERLLRVVERFVPENWSVAPPNATSSTRFRAKQTPRNPATPSNPWNLYEAVSAAFHPRAAMPQNVQSLATPAENSAGNSRHETELVANSTTPEDAKNFKLIEPNFANHNAEKFDNPKPDFVAPNATVSNRISGSVSNSAEQSSVKSNASRAIVNAQVADAQVADAQITPDFGGDSEGVSGENRVLDNAAIVGQSAGSRALESGRIPLHGILRATISASGTFASSSKSGVSQPLISQASATLLSDDLSWRGRDLGALNADVSVRDDVIRINDFSLLRHLSAREIAVKRANFAEENVADDSTNDGTLSRKLVADNLSQVRVFGTLPLDVGAPRAVPFDTTISVENERFSVLRDALQEAGRLLKERGLHVANLEILLDRVRALPTDLEGRLNARAHLGGHWNTLAVGLDADIDSARTSTQILPGLQTSLLFVDGEIQVNDFQIKQTFSEDANGDLAPAISGISVSDELLSGDGTTEENSGKTRNVRETALRVAPGGRIVPGGEISLDVDILKANLAQLAGWLPELQQIGGKSLLRGELSLFSFEVRGQTASPEVTGSIEARDLSYRNYTLDRLRVAQFEIKNGLLSIEAGKLTVVKGGFQSSAAYGSVPWNWGENGALPGPSRSGALNVHLPLQTRDFGALAGAFVPALTSVAADEFSGSVDVAGSIDDPKIAGQIQLKNARFRAEPSAGPFAFGVTALSGAVRFVDGNRVLVDGLSGQLTRAQAVSAPATGNRPQPKINVPAANAKSDFSMNAGASGVGATAAILRTLGPKTLGQKADAADIANAPAQRPDLSGTFKLGGVVDLDFNAGDLLRGNAADPISRLALHRYDLEFSLRDGAFGTTSYSGMRDISLDTTWKTGAGAPQNAQNLTWKLSARGRPELGRAAEKKTRGTLVSVGTARLSPRFSVSVDDALRSRFDGDVKLRALAWQVRNLGRGELDGDLKLDNKTLIENALESESRRRTRALEKPVSAPKKSPVSASSVATSQPVSAPPNDKSSTRSSAQIAPRADVTPQEEAAKNATDSMPESASKTAVRTKVAKADVTLNAAKITGAKTTIITRSSTSLSDLINGIRRENRDENATSSTRFSTVDAENASAVNSNSALRDRETASPNSNANAKSTAENANSKNEISVQTTFTVSSVVSPSISANTASNAGAPPIFAATPDAQLDEQNGVSEKTTSNIAPQQIAVLPNAANANALNGGVAGVRRGAATIAPDSAASYSAASDSATLPNANLALSEDTSSTRSAAENGALGAGETEVAETGAPLRISGVLSIAQTEITGVPASGSGAASMTPTAPNFDIRFDIGKNVRFVTPTLRAEFGGSLAFSGTPRQPRLIGIVTTRNGQVRFPSAAARIEEGSVEVEVVRDPLTQQLQPRATIDATARGQVGRYAITIVLRGPLDLGSPNAQNLRVDVTSNPPLSQDEAFAQLTGTSLRDLDSGGTLSGSEANQAYARAVVSLLSAPLFSGIERTLQESLGLNSLTLDYRLNEPLGVEVGKAIGERIFVTYRRSLARGTLLQPSSSLRVDFRIKGGLQLGVENDSTGRNRVTLEKTFRF